MNYFQTARLNKKMKERGEEEGKRRSALCYKRLLSAPSPSRRRNVTQSPPSLAHFDAHTTTQHMCTEQHDTQRAQNQRKPPQQTLADFSMLVHLSNFPPCSSCSRQNTENYICEEDATARANRKWLLIGWAPRVYSAIGCRVGEGGLGRLLLPPFFGFGANSHAAANQRADIWHERLKNR